MYRLVLMSSILIGILGISANSQPLEEDGKAFNPYSETALAITGPVILSTKRMVFETGAFLELNLVEQAASGSWGVSGDVPVAQVFRVKGDAGSLRRGNTACGAGTVTYIAAWEEELSGSNFLGVAMFTGTEIPTGAIEEGTCATFYYSIDLAR